MNQDPKLEERGIEMTARKPVALDENLHQVVHDLHSCLQVIGLGTELLKGARDDDERFTDVCDSIDHERREAVRLLNEYLRSTRAE